MRYDLYFENSDGDKRIIARCFKPEDVMDQIRIFLADHNYKPHYTRIWYDQKEHAYYYDVGSWSEFFIWENDEVLEGDKRE